VAVMRERVSLCELGKSRLRLFLLWCFARKMCTKAVASCNAQPSEELGLHHEKYVLWFRPSILSTKYGCSLGKEINLPFSYFELGAFLVCIATNDLLRKWKKNFVTKKLK